MTGKKFIAISIFSLLVILGNHSVASAAVKAGQSCSKSGVTSTYKGVKYTCIKSGKKFVWNKGVKVVPVAKPTPAPTATPEVTPTPSPSATPTPIPTPTPTNTPLQRWDQSDKLDELLSVFAERTKGIGNFQPETIFEFGKGTNQEYKDLITSGITAAAKFWSADIKVPIKFPVIYAGVEDKNWFLSRIAFYGHSSPMYLENLERRLAMEGDQANLAGLSSTNGTFLMQFLRGPGRTTIYPGEYGTSPHEYSHAAQAYFLKGQMDAMPCWAIEGGANVYSSLILGTFMKGTNADEYITRNSSIRDSQLGEYNLWNATPDQLLTWVKLTEKTNSNECTFPGRLGYSLGLLFYEQLLGKYGQDKAITWMQSSPTKGWQSAFESVYGLKIDDWYKTEAIPYLMSEIKKIRRDWPPTPGSTPRPTPTPTPSATPIAPVVTVQGKAMSEMMKSLAPTKGPEFFKYHYSPRADKAIIEFIETDLRRSIDYWRNYLKPNGLFNVFYGTQDDLDWMIEAWKPYGHDSRGGFANDLRGRIAREGNNLNAGAVPSESGSSHLSILRHTSLKINFGDYSFITHESIHVVQQSVSSSNTARFPCWLREGSANLFGAYLAKEFHGADYERMKRDQMYAYTWGASGIDVAAFTATEWLKHLKDLEGNFSGGCDYVNRFAYGSGLLLSELLVADYGVAPMVEFWRSFSDKTLRESFAAIYKTDLDKWYQEKAIPYLMSEYSRIKR